MKARPAANDVEHRAIERGLTRVLSIPGQQDLYLRSDVNVGEIVRDNFPDADDFSVVAIYPVKGKAPSKPVAREIEDLKAKYQDRCSVLPLNGGKAHIVQVKVGDLRVKKHFGTFKGEGLQALADLNCWRVQVYGATCPNWTTGYGSTPELAVQDALQRTKDLIKDLQRDIYIIDRAIAST